MNNLFSLFCHGNAIRLLEMDSELLIPLAAAYFAAQYQF